MQDIITTNIEEEIRTKNEVEEILNCLNELGVNIITNYHKDNEYHFICDYVILIYKIDIREITISFHVTVYPSNAAWLATKIQTIDCIDILKIGDIYCLDNEGNMITGKNAVVFIENNEKDNVVKEYIKDQNNAFILKNYQYGSEC